MGSTSDSRRTLGDATVSAEDISLLTAPNWLNDNILTFWCEYLRVKLLKDNTRVHIIQPNLAYFLRQSADERDVGAILGGMGLHMRDAVLVALNDATDVSFACGGGSGTHWSVLLYLRATDAFYAFDSMGQRNLAVAQAFARRISSSVRHTPRGDGDVTVLQGRSMVQSNSYDCGVHACAVMEHIVRQICDGNYIPTEIPVDECMLQKRNDMRSVILEHAVQ